MLTHSSLLLQLRDPPWIKYHSLIASDAASRGLDVPNTEFVVNYDMPRSIENYIHRGGRTARAGQDGVVITILLKKQLSVFEEMMNGHREGGFGKVFPLFTHGKSLSAELESSFFTAKRTFHLVMQSEETGELGRNEPVSNVLQNRVERTETQGSVEALQFSEPQSENTSLSKDSVVLDTTVDVLEEGDDVPNSNLEEDDNNFSPLATTLGDSAPFTCHLAASSAPILPLKTIKESLQSVIGNEIRKFSERWTTTTPVDLQASWSDAMASLLSCVKHSLSTCEPLKNTLVSDSSIDVVSPRRKKSKKRKKSVSKED